MYQSAEPFNHGIASVVDDGIPKIINTDGRILFSGEKEEQLSVSGGRILSYLNGRFIIRDLYGTVLFEDHDNYIVEPYEEMDYLIVYRYVDSNLENAYVGFIDKAGHLIIHPDQCYTMDTKYVDNKLFSSYSPFCSELQLLKDSNSKYGYIDKNGKTIIEFIFDDAIPFENGLARVKLDNTWYYIDASGNPVYKLEN